jgi:hypothetical protein
MAVGLGIGSAAVLAPLTLGSIGAQTSQHLTGLGSHAMIAARSVASMVWSDRNDTAKSASSNAPVVTGSLQDRAGQDKAGNPALAGTTGQDTRTFGYLSQAAAGAGDPGKPHDPQTVQTPWSTQVAVAPESPVIRKQTSSKPAGDDQRRTLVRDIQRELKRVGCYSGDADGDWSADAKRAMGDFTVRVNASLPYQEPDFILLTLVQGHTGRACGAACPAGQKMTANSVCSPNAVVAKADKAAKASQGKPDSAPAASKSAAATADAQPAHPSVGSAWTAVVSPAAPSVSLATAIPAPAPVKRPAAQRPEDRVAVAADRTLPQAGDVLVRSAPPLPGRMTIGGPASPPDASPSGAAAAPASAAVGRAVPPPPNRKLATVVPAEPEPATPVTEAAEQVPPPVVAPVAAPKYRQPIARQPASAAQQPARVQTPPAPAAPVHVHRPSPQPKLFYVVPAPKPPGGSKSQRMVYDLFQRPDRN